MTDHPVFHGVLKVADAHLIDGKGRDVMRLPGGPQRLADCANALKDVWFPLAHVPAMENRIERLEQLRKEAVARLSEEDQNTDTSRGGELNSGLVASACSGIKGGMNWTGTESATSGDSVERHAPKLDPAPTFLGPEPAGEAAGFPWRFDIENATRGKDVLVTRQTKDGPVEGTTFKREIVILATKCGKVTQSYWIPDAQRWAGLSANEQPIAWMAWPSFPAVPVENEAHVLLRRSDAGLNIATRHLNIAGNA